MFENINYKNIILTHAYTEYTNKYYVKVYNQVYNFD